MGYKKYNLFIIILLVLLTGCNIGKDDEVINNQDDDLVTSCIDESEFSIIYKCDTISLKQWDNEVDLNRIFGEDFNESIEQVGKEGDTFEGSYIKTLGYNGIKFKLFSPKDNGITFWIYEINTTSPLFLTKRGIKVGDSLILLKKTYEEVSRVLDGRVDENNLAYQYNNGEEYIIFEIKEGIIVEITLKTELK